jgi:folate-dependent phosphoribosylglycinamide formyltransferase PurN
MGLGIGFGLGFGVGIHISDILSQIYPALHVFFIHPLPLSTYPGKHTHLHVVESKYEVEGLHIVLQTGLFAEVP